MQLSEIVSEVESVISSAQYDSTDVIRYINQGLQYATGLIRCNGLQSTATVTVLDGDTNVALPADASNHDPFLIELGDSTRTKLNICETMNRFAKRRRGESESGDPRWTYRSGVLLLVTPGANGDTDLSVNYYRKPDTLVDDTDVPEGIPDYLHSQILTNYACMQIFGLNNDTARYNGHSNLFNQGLSALKVNEVPDEAETDYVTDEGDYID